MPPKKIPPPKNSHKSITTYFAQSNTPTKEEEEEAEQMFEMDEDVLQAIENSLEPPPPPHVESLDTIISDTFHHSWMEEVPTLQWKEIVKKKKDNGGTTGQSDVKKREELWSSFEHHPLQPILQIENRFLRWKLEYLQNLKYSKYIQYREKNRRIVVLYFHDRDKCQLFYAGSIWKKEDGKQDRFDRDKHLETAMFRFLRKPILVDGVEHTRLDYLHRAMRKYFYKYGMSYTVEKEDK